jgi:four helix bundle protein
VLRRRAAGACRDGPTGFGSGWVEECAARYGGKYDLEKRTFRFARDVRDFLRRIPRTLSDREDGRQLVNAPGSVGANCREANEAISRKDFFFRVRICRKETKDSRYWLRLPFLGEDARLAEQRDGLVQEAGELLRIFGSIVSRAK